MEVSKHKVKNDFSTKNCIKDAGNFVEIGTGFSLCLCKDRKRNRRMFPKLRVQKINTIELKEANKTLANR